MRVSSSSHNYGAYEYLRNDPSKVSQQTLATIDALRMRVHPTISAYMGGRIFFAILVLALGCAIAVLTSNMLVLGGAVVIALLPLLWTAIAVSCITITLDKGRLQIEQGLLSKDLVNVELWRVHNLELKRTFFQRLTGNGTLIFEIENRKEPVIVKGIATGRRLQEIYHELLTLVSLLRSNPAVKGIIS